MRLGRRTLLCLVLLGCGGTTGRRSPYEQIVFADGDLYVCKSHEDAHKLGSVTNRAVALYGWVAPGDLESLKDNQSIEVIAAYGQAASKEAVARYAKAPRLRALKLWDCTFSVDKLAALHSCPALSQLILAGPCLTDEVLADLAKIESLKLIQVGKNEFSEVAWAAAERRRPDLRVEQLSR